jgi:dihydroorotate dehydrogenase electron transfer subunit
MTEKQFHTQYQRKLSAYQIATDQLRTTQLLSVKTESPSVKTFAFNDKKCAKAKPGQFLMLWIPGVDEIPLSIFGTDENGKIAVAVKNVGEATQALHAKDVHDTIGVRGPFGNSFTLTEGNVLLLGGGTGTAPLLFLVNKLALKGTRTVFVQGARTKSELLFIDELNRMHRKNNMTLITSTEDGTCGITGLCTDPLAELLPKEKFDLIYACGPEQMIQKVFELAETHEIHVEASLERLMRCAIGLCGSCVIGRYRVCKDGPIFTSEQLREVRVEFGVSKRDFDGRRIPLS